ncbi:MAG: N-6 DNA methylase [Spirochaetales bacterium]|nr:N-6 DNA methylase [Spirochaetales bacterium]
MNPIEFTDKYSIEYSIKTSIAHKKKYGQYLTPPVVAQRMSSYIQKKEMAKTAILDPGIGTGILGISACLKLMESSPTIKQIRLIGYEIDKDIIPFTRKNLNYLKEMLSEKGISLRFEIRNKDFVLDNCHVFDDPNSLFPADPVELFDIIIANPPYFKLNKDDIRAKAVTPIIYGQPNMYSAFMIIAANLLNKGGDLIFITPRSYTSGFYFKKFREEFLNTIKPLKFHLLGSRKEAFDRDSVLQEHLIIHGTRKTTSNHNYKVKILYSDGIKDINTPKVRKAAFKDIINLNSPNLPIFLPTSVQEENIISKTLSWEGSLHKYGMEISTGRVVPFRAREFLCKKRNGKTTIPLIWLNHIKNKSIEWPLENFHKEQYFIIADGSSKLINKKDNFVLLRRFSAKEEKKRLNAAPFFIDTIPDEYIAIENHVNYIYKRSGSLSIEETMGLSEILNSAILDTYFRTHNGNTEVSATEIRDMPLPSINTIKNIGKKKIKNAITIEEVDEILLHST